MANTRVLYAGLAIAATISGCLQSPFRSSGGGGDDDIIEDDDIVEPGHPFPHPDGGFARPAPARLALVTADRPPPPISGGTLNVTADGKLAVAADPDRDLVHVVDVASGAAQSVSLPEGSEPGRVVLDGAGNAHVVLRSADAVARIALGSPEMAQKTAVCQHPRGLAYDAAADALWVACASGELVSLAAKTHAELSRTFVALDLRDVIITKSGERFVSRYRSAELLHIGADGAVLASTTPKTTSSFGNVGPVTMSPTLAWRTLTGPDGKPLMLHQQAQNEGVVIQPGGYGGGCANITQPGITQYDEQGAATMTATFFGAGLSVDMALSPDGKAFAIATPGAYLQGNLGSVQVVGLSTLQLSAEAVGDAGVPVDAGPITVDAGMASDGGVAMAVDAGIAPSDAAPTRRDAGAFFDAGFPMRPFKPCAPPEWSDENGTQATAVAFASNGDLYVLSREPARLTIYAPLTGTLQYSQVKAIELSEASVRDTGHELFHSDVGSGLSCASCHGEALDDGHVWTFQGFGPRRTQNMRGGLLSTLPLHWEGDMPTFKHLVDDVMTGRMGGFVVEPEYADALATWIDAQPELKLADRDPAASARGKALFESATVACATCHKGPELTNNKSVDVGTGGVFQVPSLLGLGLRAPFMHDGCAKTMRERFEPACGGGDKHGKTSHLSEAQLADLVAYLEVL